MRESQRTACGTVRYSAATHYCEGAKCERICMNTYLFTYIVLLVQPPPPARGARNAFDCVWGGEGERGGYMHK